MWALSRKNELKCLLQVWHVCGLFRLAAETRGGGWLAPSWTAAVRSTVGGRGGRSATACGDWAAAGAVPVGDFWPLAFDAVVMQMELLFLRASGIWSMADRLVVGGCSVSLLFTAVVTVMPLSFRIPATICRNLYG